MESHNPVKILIPTFELSLLPMMPELFYQTVELCNRHHQRDIKNLANQAGISCILTFSGETAVNLEVYHSTIENPLIVTPRFIQLELKVMIYQDIKYFS